MPDRRPALCEICRESWAVAAYDGLCEDCWQEGGVMDDEERRAQIRRDAEFRSVSRSDALWLLDDLERVEAERDDLAKRIRRLTTRLAGSSQEHQ